MTKNRGAENTESEKLGTEKFEETKGKRAAQARR